MSDRSRDRRAQPNATGARAGPPANGRVIAASAAATALAIIPVFLLGALAPLMRADTDLSDFRLGFAVSAFFAMAALVSVPAGRMGERIGAPRAMALATVATATTLLGLAAGGDIWWLLIGLLLFAGAANAAAQAASNLALAHYVDHRRQGVSFGITMAAVPLATLIAGAAVPSIGVTVGWRWAFVGAAALGSGYFLLIPRALHVPSAPTRQERAVERITVPLMLLTVSAALGSAAGNMLGAFYVSSAVREGFTAGVAGALLSLGSVVGIAARVGWGWAGDRYEPRKLAILACVFALGGIGFLLLGYSSTLLTLAATTVIAFGAGWAWAGLLLFAVVRDNSDMQGTALGTVLSGVWVGGVAGPVLFGAIAERVSFTAAWAASAAMMFLAAGCAAAAHVLPRAHDPR